MSAETRRRRCRVSSTEGARIEAPKALSGVGSGKGCPLNSRLGGLGERRKLPQRGPGRSPGRQRVLPYFRVKKTYFWTAKCILRSIYAFSPQLNKGNAVPMRSKGILTMGTAFPRVPPRNDHWYVCYISQGSIKHPSKEIDSFAAVLFNIYQRICVPNTNDYSSKERFDKVIAKIKWCSFLPHSVVQS